MQSTFKKRYTSIKFGPKMLVLGDESDEQVDRRVTTEKKPHSYTSNLCTTSFIRYVDSSFR